MIDENKTVLSIFALLETYSHMTVLTIWGIILIGKSRSLKPKYQTKIHDVFKEDPYAHLNYMCLTLNIDNQGNILPQYMFCTVHCPV